MAENQTTEVRRNATLPLVKWQEGGKEFALYASQRWFYSDSVWSDIWSDRFERSGVVSVSAPMVGESVGLSPVSVDMNGGVLAAGGRQFDLCVGGNVTQEWLPSAGFEAVLPEMEFIGAGGVQKIPAAGRLLVAGCDGWSWYDFLPPDYSLGDDSQIEAAAYVAYEAAAAGCASCGESPNVGCSQRVKWVSRALAAGDILAHRESRLSVQLSNFRMLSMPLSGKASILPFLLAARLLKII